MSTYALTKERLLGGGGNKSAIIVDDPDFDGDWWGRYFPGANQDKNSFMALRLESEKINGIPYSWELGGPGGAVYWLFPEYGFHDRLSIKQAKAIIRHKFDALRIYVYWADTRG